MGQLDPSATAGGAWNPAGPGSLSDRLRADAVALCMQQIFGPPSPVGERQWTEEELHEWQQRQRESGSLLASLGEMVRRQDLDKAKVEILKFLEQYVVYLGAR